MAEETVYRLSGLDWILDSAVIGGRPYSSIVATYAATTEDESNMRHHCFKTSDQRSVLFNNLPTPSGAGFFVSKDSLSWQN